MKSFVVGQEFWMKLRNNITCIKNIIYIRIRDNTGSGGLGKTCFMMQLAIYISWEEGFFGV